MSYEHISKIEVILEAAKYREDRGGMSDEEWDSFKEVTINTYLHTKKLRIYYLV
jgi:hypothetical protein